MKALQRLIDTHWIPLGKPVKRVFLMLLAAVVVLLVVVSTTQSNTQSVSLSDWNSNQGSSGSGSTKSTGGGQRQGESGGNLTAKVIVQVVGAVTNPGVYQLEQGKRVIDAIFSAGGFTKNADQSSVNLARVLNDGEQINVLPAESGGTPNRAASKTVNLNLSDAATLDTLPGIGPTLAQRIIDFRNANGGFRSVSDLGKVAGIGQALLAKLKDKVSV